MEEKLSTTEEKDRPDTTPQNDSTRLLARPIILGDLTLASPTTETTVGGAGGASALPATPLGYFFVMMGNTPVKVPYYNI